MIFRFPKTYCSLCGLSVKHTVDKMCRKPNRQGSCEKLLTDTAHPQHLLQSFNHHHLSARPWQTTTSSLMDSPWDVTGSSLHSLGLAASTTLVSIWDHALGLATIEAQVHENVFNPVHLTTLSCSSDDSISADKCICTWNRMANAARCNGRRIPQRGENSWTPVPLFGRLVGKRS